MGGLNNFQQYFTAIQKIESESELNIFLSKNQKQIAESFSKAIRLVWSEYEAEQIHQQVWIMCRVFRDADWAITKLGSSQPVVG